MIFFTVADCWSRGLLEWGSVGVANYWSGLLEWGIIGVAENYSSNQSYLGHKPHSISQIFCPYRTFWPTCTLHCLIPSDSMSKTTVGAYPKYPIYCPFTNDSACLISFLSTLGAPTTASPIYPSFPSPSTYTNECLSFVSPRAASNCFWKSNCMPSTSTTRSTSNPTGAWKRW